MKILQITSEVVLLLVALFNIGLWACNVFRLPRYVHWIASISFLVGCSLSYGIFMLGHSVISTLWFPFASGALVYFLFVVHGVGLPSGSELKKVTEELRLSAMEEEEP